ncbi:glycosyltransferase family 4 protein [Cyanobium sp. HWJ4-Hawea]|nr:glycosyltransferase family 4 protein [Cyanobium sp. HWJ4-Hawea]
MADVVVTNFHARYTGVSATIQALVPLQRRQCSIGVWDWGRLELSGAVGWRGVWSQGWSKPQQGHFRIWHARRDIEILMGLFLRSVLGQPWKVLFTSAAPKPPGRWLNWLIGRCDAVIATSDRSADFLPCRSVVINHGVDTVFYSPNPFPSKSDMPRCLQANPLNFHQQWIGAFGRIRLSKGTDLLVEALLRVLPDYPGFSAFFTGLCQEKDQPFLDNLRSKIAAHNLSERILFLGDLDRKSVRDLYRTCVLAVAASRSEGFGLTPLEAMACGTPVLTSMAGAWPQIVDSRVGELFQTGNVDELALKMAALISDQSRLAELGPVARARAVDHYGLDLEANSINQLYVGLAG